MRRALRPILQQRSGWSSCHLKPTVPRIIYTLDYVPTFKGDSFAVCQDITGSPSRSVLPGARLWWSGVVVSGAKREIRTPDDLSKSDLQSDTFVHSVISAFNLAVA